MSAQQEFTERTQLSEQYKQLPIVLWGNIITASITGMFYLNLVNPAFLAIWLSILAVILFARYLLLRAFRNTDDSAISKWVFSYVLGAAATGSLWAVFSIYLIQTVDPDYLFIIFLALIGLTGGNISTASYRKRMFVAFSTPALVPTGLVALFGDDRIVVTLGASNLALYILTLIAVNRLSKSLTKAIRLDYENKELIKALENEKNRLKKTNQRLNQELQRKLSMTKWLAAGAEQSQNTILTDVSNGNFNEFLNDLWEQAIENQTSLSLVIFELDGDHKWPDTDEVTQGPYKVIQDEVCSAIRSNDVFVRINDNELAIILSNLTAKDAVSLVNRLRGKLVSKIHSTKSESETPPFTISLGIAGWVPDVTQNASELISASRHAKNMSKSRGGNQASLC